MTLPAAKGEPAAKRLTLSAAEERAVAACLTIVRACQLTDGAFAQVNHGRSPDSPVWVAPYFASHAALALLAGHERKKNPADLAAVGRWLDWCAKNQAADGYWNDFEGTLAGYKNNGKVDAWDSSAATFLLVAGRYRHAGGKATPTVVAAAKRALRCIGTVADRDGLTWATPTHKVKYLMDNIEVYAGLRAGAEFFTAIGAKVAARQAGDQADRIGKRLPCYWVPADNLFAYALHPNGTFESGLGTVYPHALAQLFGVGFVAPQGAAWASAVKKFSPEAGPAAAAGAERWLIAASRLGDMAAKNWRAKVVKDVAAFTSQNVYVYRPAVAALGLLEGANWMPSIAGEK